MEKRFIQIVSITALSSIINCCISSLPIAILEMTSVEEANHYNWTVKEISMITNAFHLVATLTIIPNNYLPKYFRPENIISLSVFAIGALYLGTYYVSSYSWWSVYLIQAISGYFFGAFTICSSNMMSNWTPVSERTRILGLNAIGNTIGSVFGTAGGGIIIEKFGWLYVFILYGLVTCLLSVVMKFILVDSPHKHPTITAEEMSLYENNSSNNKTCKKFHQPPWCDMLKSPAIWAVNCSASAIEFARNLMITIFPLYIKDVIQMNVAEIGLLVSIPPLIGCISIIPISWVSDHLIKRGIRIVVVRKIFNSIGLWGWAGVMGLFCCTKTSLNLLLLMGLGEFFQNAAHSSSGINFFDICPTFVGSAVSIQGVSNALIFSVGPLISGFVLEHPEEETEWHTLFIFTVSLLFFMNVIFLILAKGKPQKWDPAMNREAVDQKDAATNSV